MNDDIKYSISYGPYVFKKKYHEVVPKAPIKILINFYFKLEKYYPFIIIKNEDNEIISNLHYRKDYNIVFNPEVANTTLTVIFKKYAYNYVDSDDLSISLFVPPIIFGFNCKVCKSNEACDFRTCCGHEFHIKCMKQTEKCPHCNIDLL